MIRSFVLPGALLLVMSTGAIAQSTTSPSAAMTLDVTPPLAPNSVEQDLADAESRPAGIFKYGPVSLIDPLWKEMNKSFDEVGLKVGFAYTIVYQAATGGDDAAGGDVDLFGDWRLLGAKDSANRGLAVFSAEYRHSVGTDIAPASLDTEIGSLWGTTNGFGEQDLCLKEFYWQQHVNNDNLILRAGKIDAENYYNSNYWQSDSKYFLNQAFSSFPVRAFPSNGLGWNATAKFEKDYYISTGFQDAQGKKTESGFDTFFEDFNLFSALEFGWTPELGIWGRGTYRATAWYRDAGESTGTPHDAGFDISIDQHMGPEWIPFFRAGIGEGNINGIEAMVSGGIGWQGKLITVSDVVGFGGSWGKPSDHDLDDQYALETFYRLQVSGDNQFTVGYQVIINPSLEPDDDIVGVLELRWRITF